MAEEQKKINTQAQENSSNENNDDVFENEFLSMPQLVWRILKKHKLGLIAMWILAILYILAIFADFFSPMNPYNNHIKYRFLSPQKVYSKNLVTGEKVGSHVYLYEQTRDPVTRRGTFLEATHLDKIVGFDEFQDKDVYFELGTYNETYDATVNNIQYYYKSIIKAKTKNGEYIQLENKTDSPSSLIPVDWLTGENVNSQPQKDGELYSTSFSKLLNGEEVVERLDNRPLTINEFKENFRYSSKLKDKEIESIDFYKKLDFVLITIGDFDEVELYPENLKAVNFKEYKINWFVKSWEYKLLGFIPASHHLFGTEKTLLPEYNDYLSDEGLLFLWGADQYGRDMISRIVHASRISLSVGLVGILITFTIGLFLGGLAGFYGGWTDEILMRFTEILMSIPSFYLIISLAAVMPPKMDPAIRYLFIIIILSFIGWPSMTRVIRGMTLGIKQTEFVEAAIAMGYPGRKIIWGHLIPNTATYIIVSATLQVPGYILGEAGLSFLGIGITEPSASWGLMLSQAQNIEALTNYPWLMLPGLFIFITVISFNLFGDAVRDALDPRSLGR
ncbi:peptide/nickel transport system permease protein [Oceanotoga teriensis]|uniref:Peptide/nickel transport system permease protein n=1 Tax=Oceanotoga teriensis TaxID=515440 RepID=A0AA45C799_9BACT|nr:ABC transporter permease [Oceanotoga teriensis]PWJ95220.1 peptide/nickel transport system permease protein [Oceanotoga teriensis]